MFQSFDKRFLSGAVLVCMSFNSASAAEGMLVDDFNGETQNQLGGYRGCFQKTPSAAAASRVQVKESSPDQCLKIEAHRHAEGYCGTWIHMFDMKANEKKFVDSQPFGFLSFWIRGERGGEEVAIKLADKRWIEKEDSIGVGRVSDFLPKGITTEWQEVRVPLQKTDQLDWKQLGGFVLEFDKQGGFVVFVDNIGFKPAAK